MNTQAIINSIPARAVWMIAMSLAVLFAQTQLASAQNIPRSFADLAEKVSPAVVNISTSMKVATSTDTDPVIPRGAPYERFFREFLDRNLDRRDVPRRSNNLGAGFIISSDGLIVTNQHVIESADEIQVETYSGEILPATLIGRDPNTDIALLKVESESSLPHVSFGNSDVSRVGDWVMAVGNPLNQGFSVSVGIISARNRTLAGSYDDYIQTDAAINKGNSGGPLFNMDGEVIGVNTAIFSPDGGSIGIGFAMSSAVVDPVVEQLKEFGETRRGWLGVQIQDIDEDVANALGLDGLDGALISGVMEGPALDGGLQSGDVILSFDGVEIEDTRQLVRLVGDAAAGKDVEVVLFRDGEAMELTVTLGRREEAERLMPASAPDAGPIERDVLGLTVTPLTDELREQLGLDKELEGLVVNEVDQTAAAYDKGLRSGDVITEVGQKKALTVADLEGRVAEAKEAGRTSILLLVRRDGSPMFVALPIG